ncbi:hypothetical protein, partial [Streptomyces californicus]|uniref:hypothetical protein n=1 Tax=Streptomyces californicus TaxID=67351 RepID=UPI0036615998
MTDRRPEGTAYTGAAGSPPPVPADMPDQQTQEGEDALDIPVPDRVAREGDPELDELGRLLSAAADACTAYGTIM